MKKRIYVLDKKELDNTNCINELKKRFKAVYVLDADMEFDEFLNYDKYNSLIIIDNIDINTEILNRIFRLRGKMKLSEVAIACIENKDYYFEDKKHFYKVCDGAELLGVAV